MGKICTSCKEWKADAEYHANGDRLRGQCKICRTEQQRMTQYTLSSEWYADKFESQGGACAICKVTDVPLVIDHDHRCCPGKTSCGLCVRELLCRDCNLGLGYFDDDPERIQRAIEFLDRTKSWEGGL